MFTQREITESFSLYHNLAWALVAMLDISECGHVLTDFQAFFSSDATLILTFYVCFFHQHSLHPAGLKSGFHSLGHDLSRALDTMLILLQLDMPVGFL
jgi:hypothetical protein